jgi:hypothetical protein
MAESEDQKILSRIAGEQLSAVCFVMDYLQLQFEDNHLTVLTPLSVRVADGHIDFGDPEYRNVLCGRITRVVTDVTLAHEQLDIRFDDGSAFIIALKVDGYAGNEAINFQFRENGRMQLLVLHAV